MVREIVYGTSELFFLNIFYTIRELTNTILKRKEERSKDYMKICKYSIF